MKNRAEVNIWVKHSDIIRTCSCNLLHLPKNSLAGNKGSCVGQVVRLVQHACIICALNAFPASPRQHTRSFASLNTFPIAILASYLHIKTQVFSSSFPFRNDNDGIVFIGSIYYSRFIAVYSSPASMELILLMKLLEIDPARFKSVVNIYLI